VAICDEEASRFHSNFWGSRAIAGLISPGEADRITDQAGVSLAQAMRSCGLDPASVAEARRSDLDAFIELHIEQGPVLEKERVPVAAVTAITAIEQLECQIVGRADHAGGCPMDGRLDPMVALAEMVLAATEADLEKIAAACARARRPLPVAVRRQGPRSRTSSMWS